MRRYIFYKNVYVFINRLKNIAVNKGNDKIREILSIYFRGEAFI